MAGRIALFPGSFDPFTRGHLDVVETAATVFDSIHIGIGVNSSKRSLLSIEERILVIQECIGGLDLRVSSFDGLVVDHAKKIGASAIVRGLRQAGDFDYEQRMAVANRLLAGGVPTVFFTPRPENLLVSSTIVRDIHKYGGDVSHFVPPPVLRLLNQKRQS